MFEVDLSGKVAAVFGVANHRSLAWGISRALTAAGARLAFTYQGERLKEKVGKLAAQCDGSLLMPCDVTDDAQIEKVFDTIESETGRLDMLVHSIAFAPRAELEGRFVDTSRQGFGTALDISAYSLIRLASLGSPLMVRSGGGAMVTLTYMASERVVPKYNVMGTAKAALEHAVRQLAFELGPAAIRVNAISAGPVSTLAARGVSGLTDMLAFHRNTAPLKRNITLDEVGRAALFLLSDLSSGVTGEVLHVDAGFSTMAMT
ncbi:MAG: enoyl-ACP reductase [Acidobacteriota bacterium]